MFQPSQKFIGKLINKRHRINTKISFMWILLLHSSVLVMSSCCNTQKLTSSHLGSLMYLPAIVSILSIFFQSFNNYSISAWYYSVFGPTAFSHMCVCAFDDFGLANIRCYIPQFSGIWLNWWQNEYMHQFSYTFIIYIPIKDAIINILAVTLKLKVDGVISNDENLSPFDDET